MSFIAPSSALWAEGGVGDGALESAGLADGLYVGRELLLRPMVESLLRPPHRSFMVLGGPKLGKTGLLHAIKGQLRRFGQQHRAQEKRVAVYLDAAVAGSHHEALFVRRLWEAVSQAALDPQAAGRDAPPRLTRVNFQRARDPWQLLEKCCVDLWEMLRGTSGWCRYVLLLDNAEALLKTRLLDKTLQCFGAWVVQGEAWTPSSLVVAGGTALQRQVRGLKALRPLLRPVKLAVLRDSEAQGLVRAVLGACDPEWCARLVRLSGKHPYVLRRLLRYAAALKGGCDETAWQSLAERTLDDCTGLFAAIEQQLPPPAQRDELFLTRTCMAVLLQAERAVRVVDLEKHLRAGPVSEALECLEYLGVIESVLIADELCVHAPVLLWNEWYRQQMV